MKRFVLVLLPVCAAARLLAQCPDGTPPPCAAARAAARVVTPTVAERGRRFLVLPFRNLSRAPEQEWLVEGSTAMLAEAIGRWQGVTVVPDERLYPALRRAGITPGSVMDLPKVRRVAEETGGWTAITGEVLATGGRVRVTARAYDIVTNREIVRTASEVPASADVRLAYDSLGTRLLRSAGLDSGAVDLAGTTTRSLDAYRAYMRGLGHARRSEPKQALAAFNEAVRLDSSFALGWARLAEATAGNDVTSIFNPDGAAQRYAARAVALATQLPPRHKLLVQAVDALFRAQFSECRQYLEALLAADSLDVDALEQLAELEAFDPILVPVPGGMRPRGSWNRAVRLAKRVLEIDPGRHSNYSTLTSAYASTGGLSAVNPVLGTSRIPSSWADFIGHREALRQYAPFLRDTFYFLPAESAIGVERDSIEASRRRARAIAQTWAQRWAAVAPGEAAAHATLSELADLDADYAVALRELTTAESLGVETPSYSPPVRRLTFMGKLGRLDEATRLADSIMAARLFANSNTVLTSYITGLPWELALLLRAGRTDAASSLLEQTSVATRIIDPGTALYVGRAFEMMLGGMDPDQEPKIPAQLRAEMLDSVAAHAVQLAGTTPLGPWLPVLMSRLADATRNRPVYAPRLLDAANTLAPTRPALAFQIASNAVLLDSTLEPRALSLAWYEAGVAALATTRIAVLSRFHASRATITADRAVFEWRIDGDGPFAWNRPETPPGRAEFRWTIDLQAAGRGVALWLYRGSKVPGVPTGHGTVEELLTPRETSRLVLEGPLQPNGPPRLLQRQGVDVRTEYDSGVFRMILVDPTLLAFLRQNRPDQARFRFFPCAQTPGQADRCMDERVAVTYP